MSESPVAVAGFMIDAEYNGAYWRYIVSSPNWSESKHSHYLWPTRETALIAARVDYLTQAESAPLLADIFERIATLESYMHRHDARLQKLESK